MRALSTSVGVAFGTVLFAVVALVAACSDDPAPIGTPDAATDAPAGNKENGSTCTGQNAAGNAECKSGQCRSQGTGGGGGGTAGNFCSIPCTNTGTTDPKCTPTPPFSGKCSGNGYCQVQ